MGVAPEAAVESRQLLVKHGVARDGVGELVQLVAGGKLAVQKQVADLHEGRMLGELVDRVAAVEQYALVAVDIGDRALAGGGRGEAGIVGEGAGLRIELADVDHVGPDRALAHGEAVRIALAEGESGVAVGHYSAPSI